jgi:hypothetical protein
MNEILRDPPYLDAAGHQLDEFVKASDSAQCEWDDLVAGSPSWDAEDWGRWVQNVTAAAHAVAKAIMDGRLAAPDSDPHADCMPGWCVLPPSDPRHENHPVPTHGGYV